MTRPTIGKVQANAGESVELVDWLSLNELPLIVTGVENDCVCICEGCDCGTDGFVLTFERSEIEQLRDHFTAWLERGEL